jgi:hypothetical protein
MDKGHKMMEGALRECGYEPDTPPLSIKFDDQNQLLCLHCGGEYLHHIKVTSFDRKEDAERVLITEIHHGHVGRAEEPSDKSRNPSSRRDGLAIEFGCELCSQAWELTFAQHKGNTIYAWRFLGSWT